MQRLERSGLPEGFERHRWAHALSELVFVATLAK
jgi:hypothetical protein